MNTRGTVVAGLIASLVMGMIDMVYEAVAGDGFWAAPVYIGATVLRGLQTVPRPVSFNFLGVVLGLMGHMMNSVILGLIFAAIVSRGAKSRSSLVGWAVVYALAVFVVMWYVVAPAIDPVLLNLNATVFAIAHIMWGAVLGLALSRSPEGALQPKRA
jgi:hypothetical protein